MRTWPSRSGSPRTGRHRRRDVHAQRHALAVGEQAQALGRLDRGARQIDVLERPEAAAALDPGQVQQLADHLDEVAGLDLDLADPVAHLGRQGVAHLVGLAGQGLGQQADGRERRAQLVRQVVDELGPDALEPAELRDVGQEQRRAAARARRSPGSRASARRRRRSATSPTASPVDDRLVRDRLGRRVQEDLDEAPADEVPGGSAGQGVGGRIGPQDVQVRADIEEPLVQRVGQGVARLATLRGGALQRGGRARRHRRSATVARRVARGPRPAATTATMAASANASAHGSMRPSIAQRVAPRSARRAV